jgi:hypothetical protein
MQEVVFGGNKWDLKLFKLIHNPADVIEDGYVV